MNMEYEIVTLEEKIAVGIAVRTNNASPDMGAVIGGLWNRFYKEGIYASISDKKSEKALGIYTDYEGDEKSDYMVLVAYETSRCRRQGSTRSAKSPQADMQSLSSVGIWCRLLWRPGRKYGRWICQEHSSVILRSTRTTAWSMQKSIFISD